QVPAREAYPRIVCLRLHEIAEAYARCIAALGLREVLARECLEFPAASLDTQLLANQLVQLSPCGVRAGHNERARPGRFLHGRVPARNLRVPGLAIGNLVNVPLDPI